MYFRARDVDGSDIEKAAVKKDKWDIAKQYTGGISCFGISFIIFAGIASAILWNIYLPSQIDPAYVHGKCNIYNNTINTVCPNNICEYSVVVDIKYINQLHMARGKFTIPEKSFADAEKDRTGKYAIGRDISCYYSKTDHTLHLTIDKISGDPVAGIFVFIFFVIASILMLMTFLTIIMCVADML